MEGTRTERGRKKPSSSNDALEQGARALGSRHSWDPDETQLGTWKDTSPTGRVATRVPLGDLGKDPSPGGCIGRVSASPTRPEVFWVGPNVQKWMRQPDLLGSG